MSFDEDPIFDIIHSLPISIHSVAIANRTPTANYSQQSKFMPDYGGILETPNSSLKNNALARGFPFQSKSSFTRLSKKDSQVRLTSNESLAVASYLNSDATNQFSTIRAIEKDLIFDSIEDTVEGLSVISYARLPLSRTISGIKLSQELLLVKSENKVRTFKLNRLFQLSCEPSDPKEVVNSVSKVSERKGFYMKDACINQFNKTIQGVASDNQELYQVKLYDLAGHSRQPFQEIVWASNESNQISPVENESVIVRHIRGRVVRTFIPSEPATRGIQQLDNIPSHLVNMLVTTDYRTALIDPRQERLGQVYVDKTEIPSIYPIEYLRRTEFSLNNHYQFYSLTNVHIRVFDTRYPGLPMNQVNHMLESSAYDNLNLKVIRYKNSELETLCVSCPDRLCFSTFDQTRGSSLINPKSTHLPYHEPIHEVSEKLFGLGVTTNLRSNNLFAVLQLSEDGNICIRRYKPHNADHDIDHSSVSRAEMIVHQDNTVDYINSKSQLTVSDEIEELDALTSDPILGEIEYINILETITDLEEKIKSRRALDRFEKMRNKLETI